MADLLGLDIIKTGELAGAVSATQMPDIVCTMVKFKAHADNAGNVYIGGAGVTVPDGTTDVTTGYQLAPNDETGWLHVDNLNTFYRICENAGDDLTYLAAYAEGYCTLAELRARLTIGDVDDDAILLQVIESTSRWIDDYTQRRFFVTTSDETRYFSAEWTDLIRPGDLVSVTSITTDEDGDRTYERTWQTTDYDLEPFNAALDGLPYVRIRTTPNGNYAFPTVAKGIKIVGKWGYPSVPAQIKEACLIQSARIFKRKDAPLGVTGDATLGELRLIPKLDVDVQALLAPFVSARQGILGI